MCGSAGIVKGHSEFPARFDFPHNIDAKLNAISQQRLHMSFQRICKTELNSKSIE